MIPREDYMKAMSEAAGDDAARERIYREYYGQYVTDRITRRLLSRLGVKRLAASTDPHLNDISLATWDEFHEPYPRATMEERGVPLEVYRDGTRAYCRAFTVCVYKEAARLAVEKAAGHGEH